LGVMLTVIGARVSRAAVIAPIANPDSYNITTPGTFIPSVIGVLANDICPSPCSSGMSAVLGTTPNHGHITMNLSRSFQYTVDPG
jgi:Bacterial Ig domain